VFNLLMRRFVGVDEAEKWDVRAVRLRVASVIKGLVRKFKGKAEKKE
jgi:phosphatidylinositol glycan class T